MQNPKNLFGRQDSRPRLAIRRWPLCAVAVAGGLMMLAPAAQAKPHWQMSWWLDGTSKGNGGQENWSDYLDGSVGYNPATGMIVSGNGSIWPEINGMSDSSPLLGGSGRRFRATAASVQGKLILHFKWVQEPVVPDESGQYPPAVPADKVLLLRIAGGVIAKAFSSTGNGTTKSTFGKIEGKEDSEPSPSGILKSTVAGAMPGDTSKPFIIPLSVAEGENEVEYTFPLSGQASTEEIKLPDDDDNTPESPYSSVYPWLNAEMFSVVLSPSPNNLALDDGSSKGLNQYTIDQGIPTFVSANSTDMALLNYLKSNSSWSIEGSAPALRPLLDNYISGSTVGPQHPSLDTSSTPEYGLKFDVQTSPTPSGTSNAGWSFPSDNSKFGQKTLKHKVGDAEATAPVGLFFPSTGFQHPTGGPKKLDRSEDGVPNYIYYYSKAYPAPWGIEVRFWNQSYSAYADGDPFVRTGTDSHGLSDAAEYGFADNDGGIDTDMFAPVFDSSIGEKRLKWVGGQKIRGLDLYARNVYHECVHKRLFDHRQTAGASDPDDDNDGLPNSIENKIGTKSGDSNSVPWANPYTDGVNDISDQETFCRMCERDLPVGEDDWADDGFNHGRPAAPNRQKRVVEYFWSGYTRDNLDWVDTRSLVP